MKPLIAFDHKWIRNRAMPVYNITPKTPPTRTQPPLSLQVPTPEINEDRVSVIRDEYAHNTPPASNQPRRTQIEFVTGMALLRIHLWSNAIKGFITEQASKLLQHQSYRPRGTCTDGASKYNDILGKG
eukprot:gene3379-biopygen1435